MIPIVNLHDSVGIRLRAPGHGQDEAMTKARKKLSLAPFWFCCATMFSFPAHAQDQVPAELEALIAPALQEDTGVALARRQIAESDLLGAAATLERVMLVDPEAIAARLLHAGVLCRLDDRAGARVQLSMLRGQTIADAAWNEFTAACGAMPRPEAQPGSGQ